MAHWACSRSRTYFSEQTHQRDLYFVMVTGHFQIRQFMQEIPNPRLVVGNDATSRWMNAVSAGSTRTRSRALSMEHLGVQVDRQRQGPLCTYR